LACVSGQTLDEGGGGDAGEGNASGASGTGSGGAVASGGNVPGGMSGQIGTGGLTTGGAPTGGAGGAFPTGGTFPDAGSPATGGVFPTGGTFPDAGSPATGGAFGGAMTGGTSTGGSAGRSGGTGGTAGKGGTSTGGTAGKGGTSGSATGGTGGTIAPPPNINGGQNAWASRYWDCCKPACGWTANVGGRTPMHSCSQQNQTLSDNNARNACESGGSAFMCWSGAPWDVGGQLSYGFAAASGGNYVCGRCYHIQFNGSGHNGTNPGVTAINGKHMIVQVINNGGVAQDQFDLLIPGGGVGALNACDDQWGSGIDLGAQYGGWRATCGNNATCIRDKCNAAFNGKPELMAGCEWFIGWFAMADNPNFTYERIACPSAITQRSGLSDPG